MDHFKSHMRGFITRSEIRKKQHDFKSAYFECRKKIGIVFDQRISCISKSLLDMLLNDKI